jgi:hypothetical protein
MRLTRPVAANQGSEMKLRVLILLLFGAVSLRAQDDLPKHASGGGADFPPKLLLENPEARGAATPTPSPEARVQQCQAALLDAQKRAVDAEQLYKDGILAKVEMEARFMCVIQAGKELADANVDAAAAHADAALKSFSSHAISQADLDAANAALKAARDAAATASAEWDKAQVDAAILNYRRIRQLYSEGVVSKRELQAAEDRVTQLGATPPP